MKEFVVRKSITVKAPASEVTFKGRMFWAIPIKLNGNIEKIEPGKLLKYTIANASDNSCTKSVVTDELNYAHGETELTVTDDIGQGKVAEKQYNRSVEGWDKILNGLKELVEGE